MIIKSKIHSLLLLALAAISGYFTYYAFAPYEHSLFLYEGLLVYIFLLNVRKDNGKASILLPFVWDFSFTFATLYWLNESVNFYGDLGFSFSLFLVGAVSVLIAQRTVILALLWQARNRYLFVLPFLFTIVSYFYNSIVIQFDWLNFGYSSIDNIARGLAPLGGVSFVQFIKFALATGLYTLLAYLFRRPISSSMFATSGELKTSSEKHRPSTVATDLVMLSMTGVIALWAYFYQPIYVKVDNKPISVALVQPDIASKEKWDIKTIQKQVNLYGEILKQIVEHGKGIPPDLVVFPESSIGIDFNSVRQVYSEYANIIVNRGGALLAGSIKESYNSAILITSIGTARAEEVANQKIESLDSFDLQTFNKKHLVPFGEYLPASWLLKDLHPFFHSLDQYGFKRGSVTQGNLKTQQSNLAIGICYDTLFGDELAKDIVNNTGAIVSISNDVWFGLTEGPHQHFNVVRFRAIENQRYTLRDANNGITGVIDYQGNIVDRIPQNVKDVLYSTYYNVEGETPYQINRYLFIYFVLVYMLLGLLLARLLRPKVKLNSFV